MSTEEIIADYPDLSEESIRVVIGYASSTLRNEIVLDAPPNP